MVKRFTLEEASAFHSLNSDIVKVEDFLSNTNAADLAGRIAVNLNLIAPLSVKTICDTIIEDHKNYLEQLKDEREKLGRQYKS